MRTALFGMALCTSMAIASGASSATLSGTFAGDFDGFDIEGAPVTAASAGALALTEKDTAGNTLSSFLAYCLDLGKQFISGSTYSTTDTPYSNGPGAVSLSATQIQNIDTLFELADPLFGAFDVDDEKFTSGLNLALWEVVYETDSVLSVSDGSFKAIADDTDGGEVAAVDYANILLGDINAGVSVGNNYQSIFWESAVDAAGNRTSQNVVQIAPVPLPAAGLMLLAGLGGLAAMKRRRTAV